MRRAGRGSAGRWRFPSIQRCFCPEVIWLIGCRHETDKSGNRSYRAPTDKTGHDTSDNTILRRWCTRRTERGSERRWSFPSSTTSATASTASSSTVSSHIKSFGKSQSPHKSVNLFSILVMIKDKLSDLCGN